MTEERKYAILFPTVAPEVLFAPRAFLLFTSVKRSYGIHGRCGRIHGRCGRIRALCANGSVPL